MHYKILLFISNLSPIKPSGLPNSTANSSTIGDIISIFLGVIGALAVLMIVVSGLRYILSAGEPQKAAQARQGIVYALVGLAIAISAQAIVYYVVDKL